MRKILVVFLFVSYIGFSQESIINANLFAQYSYPDEVEGSESLRGNSDEAKGVSLFPLLALAVGTGIAVGMREGVYRDNPGDNWWGTVNGALTLGLGCEVLGAGIVYGIWKLSGERFDKVYILLAPLLGLAGGVTMAFFEPFNHAFRENAYLYYLFPVMWSAALAISFTF